MEDETLRHGDIVRFSKGEKISLLYEVAKAELDGEVKVWDSTKEKILVFKVSELELVKRGTRTFDERGWDLLDEYKEKIEDLRLKVLTDAKDKAEELRFLKQCIRTWGESYLRDNLKYWKGMDQSKDAVSGRVALMEAMLSTFETSIFGLL